MFIPFILDPFVRTFFDPRCFIYSKFLIFWCNVSVLKFSGVFLFYILKTMHETRKIVWNSCTDIFEGKNKEKNLITNLCSDLHHQFYINHFQLRFFKDFFPEIFLKLEFWGKYQNSHFIIKYFWIEFLSQISENSEFWLESQNLKKVRILIFFFFCSLRILSEFWDCNVCILRKMSKFLLWSQNYKKSKNFQRFSNFKILRLLILKSEFQEKCQNLESKPWITKKKNCSLNSEFSEFLKKFDFWF